MNNGREINMHTHWKKLLSLVLAVSMVCSMIVLPVSAEGTDPVPTCTECTVGTFNGQDGYVDGEGRLHICANNFPDPAFRAYVAEFGGDGTMETVPDGWLTVEEITNVPTIACPEAGITSLEGIRYYTSLEELHCSHNALTTLDLSANWQLKNADLGIQYIQDAPNVISGPGGYMIDMSAYVGSDNLDNILSIQDANGNGSYDSGYACFDSEPNGLIYEYAVPTDADPIPMAVWVGVEPPQQEESYIEFPSAPYHPGASDVETLPAIDFDTVYIANIANPGEAVYVTVTATHTGEHSFAALDNQEPARSVSYGIYTGDMSEGGIMPDVTEEGFTESLEEGQVYVLRISYTDDVSTGQILFAAVAGEQEGPDEDEGIVLPDTNEMTDLTLGQQVTATIENPGDCVYFTFTPTQDDVYMFRSLAQEGVDTSAQLYQFDPATGGHWLMEDDDSGEYLNFMIPWHLYANSTYVLEVRFLGEDTGSFPIMVDYSPVVSVDFSSFDMYAISGGEYRELGHSQYYHYDWMQYLPYTVTLANGEVVTGNNNSFTYNDLNFHFHTGDSQEENHWYESNSYPVTAMCLGRETTIEVSIVTPPTVTLNLQPAQMEETYCTSNRTEMCPTGEVTYTHFDNWLDMICGTVTIDGVTCPIDGGTFTYNGMEYRLWGKDTQNYANAWYVGYTYNVTVGIMGTQATTTVTIVPEGTLGGDDGQQMLLPALDQMAALTLDQQAIATISTGEGTVHFYFTPAEDDVYMFRSLADTDICADLYSYDPDTCLGQWLSGDDDSGEDTNFMIPYALTAGSTYVLVVRYNDVDNTGSFPVIAEKSPVIGASFSDVSVYYHSLGEHIVHEYGEYFKYDWAKALPYTVTLRDGTTVSGKGDYFAYTDGFSIDSDGLKFRFDSGDSQEESAWAPRNTYPVSAIFLDQKSDVNVTILEAPSVELSLDPITMEEGWCTSQWTEETPMGFASYTHYDNWKDLLTGTIKINGTDYTVENGHFTYDGLEYELWGTDTQSYANAWTVGGNYTVNVSMMGTGVSVNVFIAPAGSQQDVPVQYVYFSNITLLENMGGSMQETWDEATQSSVRYYHYDWTNNISYYVVFEDGTTASGSSSGVYYQGCWYPFTVTDNQSYGNQLTAGNPKTYTVGLGSFSQEITVSVEPFNVTGVSFNPMALTENTCGSAWDIYDEYGNVTGTYHHYYWYNSLYGTIFLDNGSITVSGSGFSYNGTSYSFDWSDGQSGATPWTAGNTYTPTVTIAGTAYPVSVTITAHPVSELEIQPLTLVAEQDGSYTYDAYWQHYFRYEWANQLRWTVTFSDGTTATGTGTSIYYNGNHYSIDYWDDQYNVHWFPGNTYEATISVAGNTYQVPVTIASKQQEGVYTYAVQNGGAIITAIDSASPVITIPSTLGGLPVTGVVGLGDALMFVQELTFPDSVTMLSDTLLRWNYQIKRITIGSGITKLSAEMLAGNGNTLEEIIVSGSNTNYCSVDGVLYDKAKTTLVLYPAAKQAKHTIPDSVTDIESLFDGSYQGIRVQLGAGSTGYVQIDGVIYTADMTKVMLCSADKTGAYVMPNTVTQIAYNAFAKSSLSNITVSDSVTAITYCVFTGSKNLTELTLPDTLTSIGIAAFEDCSQLSKINSSSTHDVNLPADLEEMGRFAFNNTALSGELVIPNNVTAIPLGAFYGTKITALNLNNTEEIGMHAFSRSGLITLTIPDTVTYMEDGAFCYCEDLTSVTIGTGIRSIPFRAFEECTSLSSVTFKGDVMHSIGERAFANCPLDKIKLPDETWNIGEWTFYGSALEEVYIPGFVTEITYKSFANSTKLLQIDIHGDLYSLDGTAFDNTAWWNSQPDGPVYLGTVLYGYKGNMPAGYHLQIKEGTTLIAEGSLNGLPNLAELTIPASLERIPSNVLRMCPDLQTIHIAEGSGFRYEDGILYDRYDNVVWGKVNYNYLLMHGLNPTLQFGEELEMNGAALYFDYADGRYDYLYLTRDQVHGYDPLKIGEQKLTVKWGNKTYPLTVTVMAPTSVDAIQITKQPTKTEYSLNQDLRTAGMVVTAYKNGLAFPVEGYDVSSVDTSTAGTKTVTVTYLNCTATYEIHVDGGSTTIAAPEPVKETVIDPETEEEIEVEYKVEVSVNTTITEAAPQLDLSVSKIQLEEKLEETAEIPQIIQESASNVVFDISLTDKTTGESITTEDDEAPITVSIPVPKHMKGENCQVLYIREDGTYEDQQARFDGSHMIFEVQHFSFYGLVESTTAVSVVSVNGVMYSSMEQALAEAKEGQTVALLDSMDLTGTHLALEKGITLDLAGYTLTVDSLRVTNGNHMVDSGNAEGRKTGLLKVTRNMMVLPSSNAQAPIWNGVDGYQFATMNMTQFRFDRSFTGNGFLVAAKPAFGQAATKSFAKTYFTDGAADNGIAIIFRVNAETVDGQPISKDFLCGEDLVQKVYGGSGTGFGLTIVGIDDITYAEIRMVVEANGVESVSDPLIYTP